MRLTIHNSIRQNQIDVFFMRNELFAGLHRNLRDFVLPVDWTERHAAQKKCFEWIYLLIKKKGKSEEQTSLLIWLVSDTLPLMGGLCSGGTGIGCMAISWILLGSLLLASAAREIRSTCSKMEAEDSCSFVPFIGGGPEEGSKKVQVISQHGIFIASLNANGLKLEDGAQTTTA